MTATGGLALYVVAAIGAYRLHARWDRAEHIRKYPALVWPYSGERVTAFLCALLWPVILPLAYFHFHDTFSGRGVGGQPPYDPSVRAR